jgi:protein-L-isoaspartate(D-aspartate) O-methyltransferase
MTGTNETTEISRTTKTAATAAEADEARERRAAMVHRLSAADPTLPARVANAMAAVPRHAFVPAAPLTDAYADQAVITKRAGGGAALSCASEPRIVAMMLTQLDPQPGERILEIGAGTGYNAALLDTLAGPGGSVTTVDIDAEVTAGARQALAATGHDRVHVATRDGQDGDVDHAPYDRIIVTVGSWDLPPAWWTQLSPGGRLVVPLRWRGQTRSIAFTVEADRMDSTSVELCGFVPMLGQEGERHATIDPAGAVALHWDPDQPLDANTLRDVLSSPAACIWSDVTVHGEESVDGIWLRLTATEPGTCRIAADRQAVDDGLCTPAIPARSPAVVDGDSLAYLTLRRSPADDTRWELGATGHGPAGTELASRLLQQIQAWGDDRPARPAITAYPATTAAATAVGTVAKQHSTLVIAY